MLTLNDVFAGYGAGDVIKNINLRVKAGENLSIIGPNGCGKTTLLRSVAGILPFRGEIKIGGRSIRLMKRREIAAKVAMLSQISGVYFSYTVFDTVMMGRYAHIKGTLLGLPGPEDKEIVTRCLETAGLLSEKDRDITELSGGMLQRVFLARTLAQQPQILLLDEPTNHLDLKYQAELIDYLSSWAREGERAVVGVFHDINLALRLGGSMMVMKGGQVMAFGKADEIAPGGLLDLVYEMDVAQYMRRALAIWQR